MQRERAGNTVQRDIAALMGTRPLSAEARSRAEQIAAAWSEEDARRLLLSAIDSETGEPLRRAVERVRRATLSEGLNARYSF